MAPVAWPWGYGTGTALIRNPAPGTIVPLVHGGDARPFHVDVLPSCLHGDHTILDKAPLAVDAATLSPGRPCLEQRRLGDEGGFFVADLELDGRACSTPHDVRRSQHDVECSRQHGPVDATGRPLILGAERHP